MGEKAGTNTFAGELEKIPGGDAVSLCIQCGTCSGGCPNADKMEHTPRALIALARAGEREEVLSSNSMWYCLSCYLCSVRCPRGIKPTDFMHALEYLAVRDGVANRKTRTPIMYKSFNDFIYVLGRVPETGFMAWYFMRTNPLAATSMLPVMLGMVRHGRLSLKATRLKPESMKQLRAIFAKAAELEPVS
jgi:heterodisulfide reductase subunit C